MRTRFLLIPAAVAAMAPAQAQTLGDVGAASSISGSMSGAGQGGTMAVGSRAMRDARGIGPAYNARAGAYMGEGGPPPGYGGAPAGYGGAPGGGPEIPNPTGEGGAAGYGAAGYGAAAAAPIPKTPIRWGKETGEGFIDALRSRPTRARGTVRTPRAARGPQISDRRLARLPAKTRSRIIANKYKKPPVSYLSYYLPEDRYKLTSGLWKYVSIEDDRARYPVRYYYHPSSPRFLSIVSQKARGTAARFNRVIGFASWRDALIAGYRPDPISKPSPGVELSTIASIAPRAEAARYAEFLYAGQIPTEEFRRTYAYILRVRGIVNSRRDTRRYLRPTIGQILLAALGEGAIPRTVGGPPRAVVTTQVAPGGYGGEGGSSGYPGGSSGYPGGSSGGYRGGSMSGYRGKMGP